jgi:hypothetical protein
VPGGVGDRTGSDCGCEKEAWSSVMNCDENANGSRLYNFEAMKLFDGS